VIPIESKTFVGFVVEDFFESNCRYLLMKDNCCGFVIDGSAGNIRRLITVSNPLPEKLNRNRIGGF
jgi:hypothetical protein